MSIYTSEKVVPYVYMCVHKLSRQFYIGSRTALNQKLPSHLDFPKYKTSSKIVKENFEEYAWTILAEFIGEYRFNNAYDFEQELIFLFWNNPLLINKSCFHNKNRFRIEGPRTQVHKDAIGKAHKGKTIPIPQRIQAVNTRRNNGGWNITEETRALLRKAHTGKTHTTESKIKMMKPKAPFSAAHKKKLSDKALSQANNKFRGKQLIVICPHCGVSGGELTMPRWHFDNCKIVKPR